ncbi:hypothetical protein Tco_0872159 [Tanacetum coccineum]
MDDPKITMEEYIQLMADKARGRDKTFNLETATYGKVYCEDLDSFTDFETDFLAIVYNDASTSNQNVSSEPTISIYNAIKADIDFRISFSDSEDEDYTFIYNKDSSSYKLILVNDLKPVPQRRYGRMDFTRKRVCSIPNTAYPTAYIRQEMELESTNSAPNAKLPILKLGEYKMWAIRIKQYFQIQDYALWEVLENGDSWLSRSQTTEKNGITVTKMSTPDLEPILKMIWKQNRFKLALSLLSVRATEDTLPGRAEHKEKGQGKSVSEIKDNTRKQGNNKRPFKGNVGYTQREVGIKQYEINMLKTEFEKVKQEKDAIDFKIEKFEKASKDLDQLLGSQITDKSKKGFGYSVVPPPHSLIYNRPKKLDLSYSGLDEFKEPEFKGYGPKSNKKESMYKSVSEVKPKEVRKNNDAPIIEDWVSDDKEQDESKTKPEKKTIIPTAAKIEKPVKKSVRPYIDYTARPMTSVNAARANEFNAGKPQHDDKGFVVSGCSRHITGKCWKNFLQFQTLNKFGYWWIPLIDRRPWNPNWSSEGKQEEDERGIVYVDDIIFGSTNKELCTGFEKLMKDKCMIGSLMYLTASRPDIMFAVCACARFQVTPKTSHLLAVKRIFRYLKGKPTLGLWYSRDSPFKLVAYTDSDYAGATLDRKFTTGGCQFLGNRLIYWKCKKQTVVATSTTEAEYEAVASCYGQVLWIQNQLLDYGYTFMNTVINIDNNSTIYIIENPVQHSKTKHIEIRHHFIRDCNTKKVLKQEISILGLKYWTADLNSKSKEVRTPRYLSLVVPLKKVGDEAVHKELGDRMERAATTASSLEAEQDSGSGPRCQDTILGDVDAQTRFETTSKQSNDPPLSKVNTFGSGEDSMQLMELMTHCTKLSALVSSKE